jgi:hypothetical protein
MSSDKLENTKEEEKESEDLDGLVTVVVIIGVVVIVITLIVFGLNAVGIIDLFGVRSKSWTRDSKDTYRYIPAGSVFTNKDTKYGYLTSGRSLPVKSERVITYPTQQEINERMKRLRLIEAFGQGGLY